MGRRLAGACVVLLTLGVGCEKVIGIDEFAAASTAAGGGGGAGGGAGQGGAPGDAGCAQASDPGLHGPAMARVMRPDGTCFWIDSTEVTVAQYADFLADSHGPQEGVCAWNTSDGGSGAQEETPGFAPNASCLGVDGGFAPDAGGGDLPVVCVDWCDALAFCVWAKKDLCKDDAVALTDSAKSDFVQACTAGDAANPYGCGCSEPTVCNGASSGNGKLLPVATSTGCSVSSAEPGSSISDLSGNVAEWTNACSPDTSSGNCLTRGGSYASSDSALACKTGQKVVRTATQPALGFRCCAQ